MVKPIIDLEVPDVKSENFDSFCATLGKIICEDNHSHGNEMCIDEKTNNVVVLLASNKNIFNKKRHYIYRIVDPNWFITYVELFINPHKKIRGKKVIHSIDAVISRNILKNNAFKSQLLVYNEQQQEDMIKKLKMLEVLDEKED